MPEENGTKTEILLRRKDDYKMSTRLLLKLGEIAASVTAIALLIYFLGSTVFVPKKIHIVEHKGITETLHKLDKRTEAQSIRQEYTNESLDEIKELLKK